MDVIVVVCLLFLCFLATYFVVAASVFAYLLFKHITQTQTEYIPYPIGKEHQKEEDTNDGETRDGTLPLEHFMPDFTRPVMISEEDENDITPFEKN